VAAVVAHPKRVQARRAKGYKAVHRPTKWGNPFPVPPYTRQDAMRRYERWVDAQLEEDPAFLEPLRGYNLGCFCAPELACHADILLRKLYGRRHRSR
jgi:hypothetical protein